jgi:hypothetical protein
MHSFAPSRGAEFVCDSFDKKGLIFDGQNYDHL